MYICTTIMRSLEVSMLKAILFVFGMVSCAKHIPQETLSSAGIMGFAGENFSSTNSPCLDGVLTAMDHSCAVPIQIEEGDRFVMIQCTNVREGSNPWDEYLVVSIMDPSAPDIRGADTTLMCMDPYTRVYIQKRP